MTLEKTVTKNTLTQIGGRFLSVLLSAVLFRIISGHLGVSGVGEYNTAFVYIQVFGAVGDLGLYLYLVQAFTKDEKRAPELLGNALGFRLAFTALLLLAAWLITALVPTTTYTVATKFGIILGALIASISLLFQALTAYFQQQYKSELIVLPETLGKIVTLVLTYLVVKAGLGLEPIMTVALIGSAVTFVLAWLIIQRSFRLRFQFNFRLWAREGRLLGPLALLSALTLVHSRIDNIILSLIKGSHSYEMGIYSGAYRMYDLVLVVPAILAGNLVPILSSRFQRDRTVFQKAAGATSLLSLLGGSVAMAVIYVFAPFILTILAGPSFQAGTLALRILSISLIALFLSQQMTNLLIATGQTAKAIPAIILVILVNAGLNIALIPIWPILAPAVLTGVTEGVLLWLKWRALSPDSRPCLPIFRSAALIGVAVAVASLLARQVDGALPVFGALPFAGQLIVFLNLATFLTGFLLVIVVGLGLIPLGLLKFSERPGDA